VLPVHLPIADESQRRDADEALDRTLVDRRDARRPAWVGMGLGDPVDGQQQAASAFTASR